MRFKSKSLLSAELNILQFYSNFQHGTGCELFVALQTIAENFLFTYLNITSEIIKNRRND